MGLSGAHDSGQQQMAQHGYPGYSGRTAALQYGCQSRRWLPLNPGTEAALALGMAHVMIQENRYSGFADQAAFGFESFEDGEGQDARRDSNNWCFSPTPGDGV